MAHHRPAGAERAGHEQQHLARRLDGGDDPGRVVVEAGHRQPRPAGVGTETVPEDSLEEDLYRPPSRLVVLRAAGQPVQFDLDPVIVGGGPDAEREEELAVASDGDHDVVGLDGGPQLEAER